MNAKGEVKRIDATMPEKRWEFDEEVTECFDDMLARSIPQYKVMRSACVSVGCRYVRPYTSIIDLGCSRGQSILGFAKRFGDRNFYTGIEVSPPMIEAATRTLAKYRTAKIISCDLRFSLPVFEPAPSLALSVLTFQFIPIEYRQGVVQRIYNNLIDGGALIVVEKVLGNDQEMDEMMTEIYYNLKRENGYGQDSIDRKRCALEGVLVPIKSRWNEQMLRCVGFSHIDCFWRWMNFAGWVAVK